MRCKGVCEKCQGDTGQWHMHNYLPELDSSAGYDEASRLYTSLSVPYQLTVKPSSIPGAGLGVFANTFISSNISVGLFEGKIVRGEDMKACDTAYAWEVSDNTGCHLVDGKDPTHANWLRYVNCARYSEEQNLIAYQYQDNIYYRTVRHIYHNDELLVWYGDDYAKTLGLSTNSKSDIDLSCQYCGDFVSKKIRDEFLGAGDVLSSDKKRKPHEDGFLLNPELKASGRHSLRVRTGTSECSVCGKRVVKASLSRHLATHTNLKPYRCKFCKQKFGRLDHTKFHEKMVHRQQCCKTCGRTFRDSRLLRRHLAQHSCSGHRGNTGGGGGGVDSGRKCKVLKGSGEKFPQLKLRVERGCFLSCARYQCSLCDKKFLSKMGHASHLIHDHKMSHSLKLAPEYKNPLKICATATSRIKEGKGKYQCHFCEKSYSRKDSVKHHVVRKHTGCLFSCKHCRKNFNTKSGLHYHILRKVCRSNGSCQQPKYPATAAVEKTGRNKVCLICSQFFKSNTGLYWHATRHLINRSKDMREDIAKVKGIFKVKEYACDSCNAIFSTRRALGIHRGRKHSRSTAHKCEHCKAEFSCFNSLRKHLKTHPEERFSCTLCNQTFLSRSRLIDHVRKIHCKRFFCHLCSKKVSVLDLARHQRHAHGVDVRKRRRKKMEGGLENKVAGFKTVALKEFSLKVHRCMVFSDR